MKEIYLSIKNYPGQPHYYGALRTDGCKDVELEYPLTVADVGRFNKDEPGARKAYRIGDTSIRFRSERHLIEVAIAKCAELYPDAMLFRGNHASADPLLVLSAPGRKALMVQLNSLKDEAEVIGWWSVRANREEMNRICDEWNKLLGKEWY